MTTCRTTSEASLTSLSIEFGPPNDKAKLELRYPYGFEVGCTNTTTSQWVEGTAKSVSGNVVNLEFPLCPTSLKPTKVRYCWRTDPCSSMMCPIYSSFMNTSPPFVMDLA